MENANQNELAQNAIKKMYQVWFEPTENGLADFGWIPEPCAEATDNHDDASMLCYELECDQRAPDWREYYRYTVRTVTPFKE